MTRPNLLIALLPAGALIAVLGACSSTVPGAGAPNGSGAPRTSPVASATTPAPSVVSTSAAPSITPVTATVTSTSHPRTTPPSSRTSTSASSSPVVGLPSQLNFSYSVDCATTTGTATATLKWTSTKNTAEVWIAQSLVAFGGGDERKDPSAKGPLSPNGSIKMVFNCAEQYNYYHMTSYNVNGNSTITQQVVRNV